MVEKEARTQMMTSIHDDTSFGSKHIETKHSRYFIPCWRMSNNKHSFCYTRQNKHYRYMHVFQTHNLRIFSASNAMQCGTGYAILLAASVLPRLFRSSWANRPSHLAHRALRLTSQHCTPGDALTLSSVFLGALWPLEV